MRITRSATRNQMSQRVETVIKAQDGIKTANTDPNQTQFRATSTMLPFVKVEESDERFKSQLPSLGHDKGLKFQKPYQHSFRKLIHNE